MIIVVDIDVNIDEGPNTKRGIKISKFELYAKTAENPARGLPWGSSGEVARDPGRAEYAYGTTRK